MILFAGDVAQLGERDNRTVEVRGSSPLISTMYYTRGRRATRKAHPTAHHPPSPLREVWRIRLKIALQIANTYGIVKFTIMVD